MSKPKAGEIKKCRVCGVEGGEFKGFYCVSCYGEKKKIRNHERYDYQYKSFRADKNKRPEPKQSIDDIALICEREGITYGQYVARELMEKERRKHGNS